MADLQTNIAIRILDAFTGPLRNFQQELGKTEERAKRIKGAMAFAADLNQAAEAMGRFSAGIIGPLRGSIDEFRGFEKAMSNVSALSDQMRGSAGFELLKQQALDLGAATSFSAQQVAEAQGIYAQAGRSVQQIVAMTPVTLAAAQANNLSIAETASIVGHTMTQMGMNANEAMRAVDVLSAAAAASDMNLSDMGVALAYVGPVAHQAGMSLELTSAFLGKMKDAGLEASSAGVGLRAVLTRLLDPSREASRALGQLGFSTRQVRDLQKQVASGHPEAALARIGEAANKLPNERRMKLMSQIFGMEAQTAASVAIQASMDVSKEGLTARANKLIADSAGTNERMARIMTDNLDGAMERAGGAISGLKNAIGESLAPTAKAGASMVEGLAGGLQKFVTSYPRFSKASLEMVGGLGGVALGLQGVLTTMSAVSSANAMLMSSYDKLSKSMTGRGGLVVAAGLAGYAMGAWLDDVLDLSNKINEMVTGLRRGGAGGSTDKQGIVGDTQVMRGGWEVNTKSGEVEKMGQGNMPAAVRRAMAAGATSREEVNAFIRRERATSMPEGFRVVAPKGPVLPDKNAPIAGTGTMLERQARDAAALSTPATIVSRDAELAATMRDQFAPVLEELRVQTRLANDEKIARDRIMSRWNTAPVNTMVPF